MTEKEHKRVDEERRKGEEEEGREKGGVGKSEGNERVVVREKG